MGFFEHRYRDVRPYTFIYEKKSTMNSHDKTDQLYESLEKRASSTTNADSREIVRGEQLNRGEFCRECGSSRSKLAQNLRSVEALFSRHHVALVALLPSKGFADVSTGAPDCS